MDSLSTVTAGQIESALVGTIPVITMLFSNHFWAITQVGATVFSYDLNLDGTGFISTNIPVILKNDAGMVTSYTSSGIHTNYTTTWPTIFSDFGLGDYTIPPLLLHQPNLIISHSFTLPILD